MINSVKIGTEATFIQCWFCFRAIPRRLTVRPTKTRRPAWRWSSRCTSRRRARRPGGPWLASSGRVTSSRVFHQDWRSSIWTSLLSKAMGQSTTLTAVQTRSISKQKFKNTRFLKIYLTTLKKWICCVLEFLQSYKGRISLIFKMSKTLPAETEINKHIMCN